MRIEGQIVAKTVQKNSQKKVDKCKEESFKCVQKNNDVTNCQQNCVEEFLENNR